MPELDARLTCQQVCDELDAFVDGECDATRTRLIDEHLAGCADCSAELALARETLAALRGLPALPCPPAVTVAAYKRIESLARPVRRPWWQLAWRPALAAGVAAILLLITGYVGQKHTAPAPTITAAQIAAARADAKWTLIYIGQLSHKSAKALREELSDPNLTAPLRYLNRNDKRTSKENEHAG